MKEINYRKGGRSKKHLWSLRVPLPRILGNNYVVDYVTSKITNFLCMKRVTRAFNHDMMLGLFVCNFSLSPPENGGSDGSFRSSSLRSCIS